MTEFIIGIVIGAIVASIPWWIKVRGFKGVKSDLADAKREIETRVKK